ncbi:MAG: ATPase, T2SS/T4P/T4SS family, partial [Woeseiaceae bacterium]
MSLVQRLLAAGLISEDQLQIALREKQSHDEPLGRTLVRLGMLSEGVLRDTLGELLGEGSIDLRAVVPDRHALAMVPKNVAHRHSVVPIDFDANARLLTLAVTDSVGVVAIDEISALLDGGIDIATTIASAVDIKSAIRRFYEYELSIPGILREIDADETGVLNDAVGNEASGHPLTRLIDAILIDAVKHDASVVHFEPEYGFLRVRYRIDGVLRQMMSVHRDYWTAMVVRLRSMARIKTAEDAPAMEGRFSLQLGTRLFEFRIACQATTQGESIVARILEPDRDIVPLENLGLESDALTTLRLMMARPEGLIIVAGAPDSGKATTVCSVLSYRSDESVSIMTLEDPVKYRMTMIRQASLGPGEGRSCAKRIESMIRQDADVMLV